MVWQETSGKNNLFLGKFIGLIEFREFIGFRGLGVDGLIG
jgi:hypothetical protein